MQSPSLLEIERSEKYFLGTIGILILIGFVAVLSSSYIYAKEIYKNPYHYVIRQAIFLGAGVIIALFASRIRFSFWYKYAYHINIAVTLLLVMTLIPGLRASVKGAYRWIDLGIIKLQPSEMLKITIPLLAIYLFENIRYLDSRERLKYILSLLIPIGLVVLQPDFGTFTICFILIAAVMFLSSFPKKYFYMITGAGISVAIFIMMLQPYRVARVMTYLDPWKNPRTSGFQIIQSYLAFASGGLSGQGLGNSNEKLFYLPEAHNDFILSVIGEEVGFLGVATIVVLFFVMIHYGIKIAMRMQDRVSRIAVTIFLFSIGLQAFLNMAVVLGLLPTKGLNLPFISYGGSSMLANLFIIGLILSAIKSEPRENSY